MVAEGRAGPLQLVDERDQPSMAAVPGGYDLSGSREAAWEARWKRGKGGAVEVR